MSMRSTKKPRRAIAAPRRPLPEKISTKTGTRKLRSGPTSSARRMRRGTRVRNAAFSAGRRSPPGAVAVWTRPRREAPCRAGPGWRVPAARRPRAPPPRPCCAPPPAGPPPALPPARPSRSGGRRRSCASAPGAESPPGRGAPGRSPARP
eukprot:9509449-Lingulodinium_polyedra.AAC.1